MKPDGTLMTVPVDSESSYGEPTVLFRTEWKVSREVDGFDVSPDGASFFILERAGRPQALMVIQNGTQLPEP